MDQGCNLLSFRGHLDPVIGHLALCHFLHACHLPDPDESKYATQA
jgi:hypothetical protein